ncbi:TolC family protein [Chondrinema litorale]|uniref:TolC family protein n=1 Tax=Chondrinema litorale TaxID=2994555 RepID=UPI00254309F9|nr:TolC family protein [Chondrinema litorale]UZR97411.1 TolC family protein [Chondrinema litorale]
MKFDKNKLHNSILKYTFLIAIVWLSGCKSTLMVEDTPEISIPSSYKNAVTDSSESFAKKHWELFFEDEQLKTLINQALQNNQEVLRTLERIKIANASFLSAKLGKLPEINAFAETSVEKYGDYTMNDVGNNDTNLSESVPADKKMPDPYTDFIIGAKFNWELDVWGKFANKKKAAQAKWLASQEMANSVKTWLISEVANLYYEIISLDEEIKVLEQNIENQQLAFELTKDLKGAGKENQLAVDQFEALLLNTQSLLIEKKREIYLAEMSMSKLLGVFPENSIQRVTLEEVSLEPEVLKIGVPADLLQLRPDVRMAESNLIASKANVKVARSAFFPSITLFGMAGFNAFELSKLFLNPESTAYRLGAGLTAPIFNRRQLKSAMETARSSQRIAYLDYQETVLKSYLEVISTLNSYKTLNEQIALKEKEVSVQRRSIDNSNTMFSVGYATYLEVINSQGRVLNAELDYITLKREQLQSIVDLYKSLGGGWM